MTALDVTATRADLIDDLSAYLMHGAKLAGRLHEARYPDVSLLDEDRERLADATRLAGQVMTSLASLGTDPGGHE